MAQSQDGYTARPITIEFIKSLIEDNRLSQALSQASEQFLRQTSGVGAGISSFPPPPPNTGTVGTLGPTNDRSKLLTGTGVKKALTDDEIKQFLKITSNYLNQF